LFGLRNLVLPDSNPAAHSQVLTKGNLEVAKPFLRFTREKQESVEETTDDVQAVYFAAGNTSE
jgi:hypothetical protein